MNIMATLAEFERGLIRERTTAGLQAARRRGVRLGRPPARFDIERAVQLRVEGLSYKKVAAIVGVSVGVLHAALRAEGVRETPVGDPRFAGAFPVSSTA